MTQPKTIDYDNLYSVLSLDQLTERIDQLPDVEPDCRGTPSTRDRWVLGSNLQKAIRLGLPDVAIATAKALLAVDEAYLFRRLVVIAFEDVGIANPTACFNVLRLFRRTALHRRYGALRVAAWLIHQLCWSAKNRSMCDGILAVEFSRLRTSYEQRFDGLTADDVLEVASDRGESPVARIAATRELTGYSEFINGSYRSIRSPRKPQLIELTKRLCLTEVETRLLVSGQGVAESINIPLAVCTDMRRHGYSQIVQNERRFLIRDGVLTSALDRHTRIGKAALGVFARESAPLREFFNGQQQKTAIDALGCAVFLVEGAMLDRELQFTGSDELRQAGADAFLEYSGVPGSAGQELIGIVTENLGELQAIRLEMLA